MHHDSNLIDDKFPPVNISTYILYLLIKDTKKYNIMHRIIKVQIINLHHFLPPYFTCNKWMERLIIVHCPIPATLGDIYQTNIKLNILFNIWMFLTSSLFITMYTQIYIYTYSSFQWMTIYWCSHYAFKIHLK